MFEAAELGRKASKGEYAEEEPRLHTALLKRQRELTEAQVPVIIIVSGVEGAGKGEVVNLLNTWLDTRGIETCAFWDESDEERQRPHYWRFWRVLPARGSMAIMFGSWYTQPIVDHVFGRMDQSDFERKLHRIQEHEQLLTDDGALIVKFWFHLTAPTQQKRLKAELKGKKLKLSPVLKRYAKHYDAFVKVSERAIRITDTGPSPWYLIEAEDRRYRNLAVGRTLLEVFERRLRGQPADDGRGIRRAKRVAPLPSDSTTVLDTVDLSAGLTDKQYDKRLASYQSRLNALAWRAYEQKRFTVAVFEGWDAAGKGGTIRRITAAMDARLYRVIQVAAPTDEEKAHHYLWRFWRHIPRAGHVTLYDRSWYGRVLVERVEGLAREDEWLRAYQEINDFEEQLVEHGVILVKFWLHISAEEQLRRFKEREQVAWKQHKITEEDWRNREKRDAYSLAVNDMVARTSTDFAPWSLIAGDDKHYARVEVIRTLCRAMQKALK